MTDYDTAMDAHFAECVRKGAEEQRVILERVGILKPMKIWVLIVHIDGSHDPDTYVHRTEHGAWEHLTDIALELLGDSWCGGDDGVTPWKPPERDAAVSLYFDEHAYATWELDEREILP